VVRSAPTQWIKNLITEQLGLPEERILFGDHHLSHAASAFLCSPFDEAAILTVDGIGEWAAATYGVGRGTEITVLKEIRFLHSRGLLYSAFTAFLGFEVNEGEYKVMGMAPFSAPKYLDKVYKLVHVERDGSFQLDMDYFSFHHSTDRTCNGKFLDLFGPPRDPHALFFTAKSGYPSYFGDKPRNYAELARENQHYADIAASIQVATEETLLTEIKFREPFRPFAPSVLAEAADAFFAFPEPSRHYPARFMLYVVDVKPDKRDVIPAITHVDGTGRLQTVNQTTNPRYYQLIKCFGEATGVPVVLNTSFDRARFGGFFYAPPRTVLPPHAGRVFLRPQFLADESGSVALGLRLPSGVGDTKA
jgi:predicted NodU family carbamoyl transferase